MEKSIAGLTSGVSKLVPVCAIEFEDLSPGKPFEVYGDSETGTSLACFIQGRLTSWKEIENLSPVALAKKVSGLEHPGKITWWNGFDPKKRRKASIS